MRQTHINTHINTITIEHRENIKAIKTQNANTIEYRHTILFRIFIKRSNNEQFFNTNQYNNQATEKDGHADADHLYDHLYDTAEADGKGNDLPSKPS